jgi:hypothetical protein
MSPTFEVSASFAREFTRLSREQGILSRPQ